jgi:hypothetical protein
MCTVCKTSPREGLLTSAFRVLVTAFVATVIAGSLDAGWWHGGRHGGLSDVSGIAASPWATWASRSGSSR